MDIELVLPWPPTVNSYYGMLVRGKKMIKYITKKGKQYRIDVAEDVREQLGVWTPLVDKMLVEVILYVPDNRTRDLDNYMKALLDACTEAGVWEDDSLINQLMIYRGEIIRGGRVTLRINEAGPVIPQAQKSPLLAG